MKKISLLLATMLVGMALLHAQGNDTLTSLRQSFPKSITAFKIMGNTKAVVVCDNASFLEFSNLSDIRDFGKAKDFAVTNGDTLWLNTDGIPVKTTLYIHIDSSAKATNIAFSGHSYGLVTGLVNGDVSISAKGHSRVVVSKGWGDTIRSGNISIQSTDSAFVNCISPLLADTISLSTRKASNIETNLVKCANLNCDENDIDNGVKFRKVYSMGDKKRGWQGGGLETVYSKGWECEGPSHWSSRCPDKEYPPKSSSRFVGDFNFLWGFNNWGSTPMSGLAKMDDAYELRTTPSSFQLELGFKYKVSHRITIGAALGYESDIYKFSNPYVTVNSKNNVKFLEIGDAPYSGDCKTRLVTRYITMPLFVRCRLGNSEWSVDMTVIPGLNYLSTHTGFKYQIDNDTEAKDFRNNTKNFINPYKLDLRLSFGWNFISFFIQPSLLPVFVNSDQKVYPIKIGIELI
jgi:hypothetical protein